MEMVDMLDVLDSIFRFVLCILLLIFCLIFAAVGGVLEVLRTVISTLPLLAFALIGSVFIVYAGWRLSKYQKAYFEKYPARRK